MIDLSSLPDDERATVEAAMTALGPADMMALVADAQEALALRKAGDEAGCRAILERYRETAEAAGLGAMLDSIVNGE